MPNKQNAKKALRQAKKRTLANLIVKSRVRQAMKQAVKATETKENLVESLRLLQKALGKAAKKGILKKKTAARKLSRLAKKVVAKKSN